MDDVEVQSFHKRSNAGEVFVNPLTYVKETMHCRGTGRMKWTRTNGWVYENHGPGETTFQLSKIPNYMVGVPADPSSTYSLPDSSMHKALGNVDRSPYAFAEDIAELHETLRFLKNPLGSIRKLSDEFSGEVYNLMTRRKYLDRAKAIADVWLTYQFAFSPLLRSSQDAVKAYNEKTYRSKRRTARGSETFSGTDSTGLTTINGWKSTASVKIEEEVRAGILYEVANPLNDWRYKYGLRFKDIPETIWAVLPYSFMVDRITNISQSVRGLVSFLDPNVKILGAWTTTRRKRTEERSYQGFQNSIVASIQYEEPDFQVKETFTFTREPQTIEIGDFVPQVRLEGLINSTTKIADLAALILQRIR
jgi:hypothetical protein